MKIISVVGARPNFIKIAPFIKEIKKHKNINHILVHTGQHYDNRMSDTFFKTLTIPKPDINLEIGSGTHAEQVGKTMIMFEKVLQKETPDWVVVVGDVNATLACSVTAKKMNIKICHIEAGLRSGDEKMPEEINRLVTDRVSDLLLTPDIISSKNLKKEGIPDNKIKFVGNIMIDALELNIQKANELNIKNIILNNSIDNQVIAANLDFSNFGIITMHRPSNVDDVVILRPIVDLFLDYIVNNMKLIWAIHPRTKKQLIKYKLWQKLLDNENIILLHPVDYLEMLKLNLKSKIIFTDSGGLQEECTVLGTPCLTLRWNTERPITLIKNGGTSLLVGNDINNIKDGFKKIIKIVPGSKRPEYWDGNSAYRCLKAILDY